MAYHSRLETQRLVAEQVSLLCLCLSLACVTVHVRRDAGAYQGSQPTTKQYLSKQYLYHSFDAPSASLVPGVWSHLSPTRVKP